MVKQIAHSKWGACACVTIVHQAVDHLRLQLSTLTSLNFFYHCVSCRIFRTKDEHFRIYLQDLSVLELKESGVDVQPSTSKTVNTVETLTFKTVDNVQPSTSAKGQDEVKISHPVQATD